MRIWDIHPGYLNRQSLLGEHRELHGIVSIVVNEKKGYARHPETLRWAPFGWALRQRHRLLAAEMTLRGYTEKSPVLIRKKKNEWPKTYIDLPGKQFLLLKAKYTDREQGRIPLPVSAQQVWAQHKYSILARNPVLYKALGKKVSVMKPHHDFSDLAALLTEQLRTPPKAGGLRNTLQHMWGHVSHHHPDNKNVASWSPGRLFTATQQLALTFNETYLLSSTALSELGVWI